MKLMKFIVHQENSCYGYRPSPGPPIKQGEMLQATFKPYIVFCYVYVYKVTTSSKLPFGIET